MKLQSEDTHGNEEEDLLRAVEIELVRILAWFAVSPPHLNLPDQLSHHATSIFMPPRTTDEKEMYETMSKMNSK